MYVISEIVVFGAFLYFLCLSINFHYCCFWVIFFSWVLIRSLFHKKNGILLGPYSYAHRSIKAFNTVLFINEAITQVWGNTAPEAVQFINDMLTNRTNSWFWGFIICEPGLNYGLWALSLIGSGTSCVKAAPMRIHLIKFQSGFGVWTN